MSVLSRLLCSRDILHYYRCHTTSPLYKRYLRNLFLLFILPVRSPLSRLVCLRDKIASSVLFDALFLFSSSLSPSSFFISVLVLFFPHISRAIRIVAEGPTEGKAARRRRRRESVGEYGSARGARRRWWRRSKRFNTIGQ